MKRWAGLLVLGFSVPAQAATPALYSFYDNGGEHGYAAHCSSGAEAQPSHYPSLKKMANPKPERDLFAVYTDNGENEAAVMTNVYFYTHRESCEAALKKARAWYEKMSQE